MAGSDANEDDNIISLKLPEFQDTTVITSPSDYYETLRRLIRSSRDSIILSALYFGVDELEKQLLKDIEEALTRSEGLHVTFIFDFNRAGRLNKKGESSISILQPIIDSFYPRFQVLLYQMPQLREYIYTKDILPCELKEIIGVYHCKFNIIDDDVILTGANLSKEYFTFRQDRYILFQKNQRTQNISLCTFLHRFHRILRPHCFHLLPENKFSAPVADIAILQEELKQLASPSIDDLANNHSDAIYPVFQHANIGIRVEELFISYILRKFSFKHLAFSSPYPSFPSKLVDSLCHAIRKPSITDLSFIIPSFHAHGFAKSKGLKAVIPLMHHEAAMKGLIQLLSITKERKNVNIDILSFDRPQWSYHTKGIWFLDGDTGESKSFSSPCSCTYIGSSNFGERSWGRDFELGFILQSHNSKWKELLSSEFQSIKAQCNQVPKINKTTQLQTVFVRFLNKYLGHFL